MSNQPIHEIKLGHVKATIWENQTKAGVRHGIKLSRIYKAEEGWATTDSFNRDDLPLVAKVADMAHSWVYAQKPECAKQPEKARSKRSQEVEVSM